MTQLSKPIVFFGTEEFSLIALQRLIDADFSIAAVVTKPDTTKGRGHKLVLPAVKVLAAKHNIPVWQPTHIHELTKKVSALNQPIGVLVSYGKIIPQSIIDLFSPGIVNLHPSLLPVYRGPSPIESAILNGDKQTGVSIMQLSAKMDAGPVYAQKIITLSGRETAPELYSKLGVLGAEMLIELLPGINADTTVPTPQNESKASYCQLIQKSDGIVDWHTMSAHDIDRQVRAYQPWPQSRARLDTTDVILTSVDVKITSNNNLAPGSLIVQDGQLFVAAKSDLVHINSLKPLGKKEMPAAAFLHGYNRTH